MEELKENVWAGFYHPFPFVERMYWRRRNSNYTLLVEEGGVLDQPEYLENDLDTYGWWFGLKEAQVRREKEEAEKAKANRRR